MRKTAFDAAIMAINNIQCHEERFHTAEGGTTDGQVFNRYHKTPEAKFDFENFCYHYLGCGSVESENFCYHYLGCGSVG